MRRKKFGGISVAGVEQKRQKNWGAQILLVFGVAGLVVGGSLAIAAMPHPLGVAGLCVAILSVITLVATAVWSIRNWDY